MECGISYAMQKVTGYEKNMLTTVFITLANH